MKKLLSMVLALAMIFSLMGVSAQATTNENVPLTVTATRDSTTGNVTLTLATTSELALSSMDITPKFNTTYYSLDTTSGVAGGANLATCGLQVGDQIGTGETLGKTAIEAKVTGTNGTLQANDTIVTYTFTPNNPVDGSYDFSLFIESAAREVEGSEYAQDYDWVGDDGITLTDTITIGTTACTHSNKSHTEKKEATCQNAGNIEYWYCSTCNKYFSDEACTNELSSIEDPQKAHDYSGNGGKCVNGCGQVQPAYEVYYELYDSAGNTKLIDGDGTNLYVYPGTTYMAKVFISANSEQTLRYFDINLSYDTEKIENVTNDETVKVYNGAETSTAGAIRYYIYDRGSSMNATVSSENPLQVAQFTFRVKDTLTDGTALTLSFDNDKLNQAGDSADTVDYDATTTDLKMAVKIITITWDGNGGKFGENESTTTTVAYNGTPVAPDDTPSRAGYTHEGWLNAATGSEVTLNGQTLTADTTYYAKWTANTYTITYALDGGSGVSESAMYTIETKDTLPTPTRAGYTFTGWKATTIDSGDGATNITQDQVFEKGASLEGKYGDVTLTAQWSPIEYTVTYELNNGSWSDESTTNSGTYTIETDATLPTPTRTGYTFAGWKATTIASGTGTTNIEQDHVFAKDASLKSYYGNVTLTAQWTVNAKAAVVEYGYASEGYQLLVVSAVPGEGNGVYVTIDGEDIAMYAMSADDAKDFYVKKVESFGDGANIYVYLIKYASGGSDPTITIKTGTNETLKFDGIMTGTALNYSDASIVNEMNIQQGKGKWYTLAQLSIERRLKADMDHDGTVSVGDVKAIVDLIQK